MLDLVRRIRTSGIQQRLFAFTSHAELIIGLYPEIDRCQEALHVAFDPLTETWHLNYYAHPTGKPEVTRTYAKELGIEKFIDFLGYLRW